MKIKKEECILVRDAENLSILCAALAAEGYRCCSNRTLEEVLGDSRYMNHAKPMGVRWQPDNEFPNCLAFCALALYDDLASTGKVFDKSYTKDHGITYAVRWFDGEPVEVGDLL